MPRLPPSQILQAHSIDPLLPLLLRPCRDLSSARNELRWLREHAVATTKRARIKGSVSGWRTQLNRMCLQRALGRPLQYLLGTEYFGDIEIRCMPRVLIPRQETAAMVTHLVERWQSMRGKEDLPAELRILDLCCGTGCISLLFAHLWKQAKVKETKLSVLGVDVSPQAVGLARSNSNRLFGQDDSVSFALADVLASSSSKEVSSAPALLDLLRSRRNSKWDVLISNPPYISPTSFNCGTARSVRNFEPKLALVPPRQPQLSPEQDQGDLFYPRLLEIAGEVDARVVLLEVADLAQAGRVATMARQQQRWDRIEIWRDQPEAPAETCEDIHGLKVRGRGHGRGVLCWRGEAAPSLAGTGS